MSAALVRQALEFVDQEESGNKKKKSAKKSCKSTSKTQDRNTPYQYKPKVTRQVKSKPQSSSVEDKVAKLLQLSTGITESKITEKIIQRAVKGKPLSDYIEVSRDEGESKSILFPEESYKKFEDEYFCS